MKILSLHCDYINFKPLKKALKGVEALSEKEKKGGGAKEALLVMTAVEKGDGVNIVDNFVKEIKGIAKQVKTNKIVLYPYVHLSNNPSSPEIAVEVLDKSEKELKKSFSVVRAPFGYYKEFEIKVKGHPLSELSRDIKVERGDDEKYDVKQLLREISKTKLDTSKLKDNDHRIIGQQMDLFSFSETAPGMPYWLPNGLIIYNELIKFWREEHKKMNYQEISTPLMSKCELYKISGHWEKFKEDMFIADMGKNEVYGIKPMNCPNAMIVFKLKPRSYKDLPLRFSDIDRLHRYELSGTLGGLLRVQSFQQDDSHNFISIDMIEKEYQHLFDVCDRFYKIFGLDYSFRMGTRPEKFLGDKKTWDKAESILKKILKKSGKKYTILEGDGAFYGPKIDIIMKDSLKREWQMGTLQLDFQLPQRFELEYTDKDNKRKMPVVVHRVIYGSLERFIGILVEHTNGRLPTWLAPVQVRVLSFTDRNENYAKRVIKQLGEKISNLRIDADFRTTTIPSKVKDAELMKIPYIIVVGDKEEKENDLAIRIRGDKKIKRISVEDFIEKLNTEIKNRE